ncbi:MAG TPA: NAD-dependent protein deacetylase [Polyangia bacterium]|jgi:NAD-dependent SIR2 family protein deacetylase|nr:NAD-dependent protein deacetylase [Polyangia bacterium]
MNSEGDFSFDADLLRLQALLRDRRFVALTGAGCSTESGIPDYRGQGRSGPRRPIQHDAFIQHAPVRQRYWARATLGWQRFSAAAPNPAHHALARLEHAGLLAGIITQNVDRLHHAAGSRRVVELHGALADVRCLACHAAFARDSVHQRLLDANPDWLTSAAAALAPDGDADLADDAVAAFTVVGCVICGGALMPNVVFFGGHVAESTLRAAWELFATAEILLVVGSSLTVYSGFRFVRRAGELGVPVALINDGPTRADDLVTVRLGARAGQALPRLAALLTGDGAAFSP